MKLVIIDGQSGRMGALLAERIKAAKLPCEVLAVGTNAIATAAMMKAGAGGLPHGRRHCRPHRYPLSGCPVGGDHPRHGSRRGAKPRKKAAAAGKP